MSCQKLLFITYRTAVVPVWCEVGVFPTAHTDHTTSFFESSLPRPECYWVVSEHRGPLGVTLFQGPFRLPAGLLLGAGVPIVSFPKVIRPSLDSAYTFTF